MFLTSYVISNPYPSPTTACHEAPNFLSIVSLISLAAAWICLCRKIVFCYNKLWSISYELFFQQCFWILISSPLAQRASYFALHSSLFGPDGTVNYDYIVTNNINSLLIGWRCIPNGAHANHCWANASTDIKNSVLQQFATINSKLHFTITVNKLPRFLYVCNTYW